MVDWRSHLRTFAALGEIEQFPLLVYRVNAPSLTPWPPELAEPSVALREFYAICDGGYFGSHYRWYSLAELLPENRKWWELLEKYPRPGGGPIGPAHHVILACDAGGFPFVWDCRTDQIVTFYFKDSDDLDPSGPTVEELLTKIFSPGDSDDMWAEALEQLREHTEQRVAPDTGRPPGPARTDGSAGGRCG